MGSVGRLFVAIPLSGEVRQALDAHLSNLTGGRPIPGRPVPSENWHLTLRFLGATEEVRRDRLLAALDQADLGSAFAIRFGGLGAFPRPARATVLWLGVVEGAERLSQLAASVEEAARAVGFPAEERPFHAHLTLSRIRPHQDVRPLVESASQFPMKTTVDRILLYRSHLGRGGARYEELESFLLGS